MPGSFDLYRRRERRPSQQLPVALRCRPAQRVTIVQQLDAIMAEQDQTAPGWELAVTAGLLNVLLITARLWTQQWEPTPIALPPRTERAIHDVVGHLEDHCTEPVNLTALARRVHLSRWHLSRSFNRSMGMSVTEFVHRLRAEEACRRLRLTDQPVGQIASDLGYNEIAYFTRCFHRHLGQSPRAYRQATRGALGVGVGTPARPTRG